MTRTLDPLSGGRDGLLMDIRDAYNRHTRALTLRSALIHCDTHTASKQKHAHRKKQSDRDTQDGGKKSYPNLAHDFTASDACCHFQYPTGKYTLIMMVGAPKCCLPVTEALRQSE